MKTPDLIAVNLLREILKSVSQLISFSNQQMVFVNASYAIN